MRLASALLGLKRAWPYLPPGRSSVPQDIKIFRWLPDFCPDKFVECPFIFCYRTTMACAVDSETILECRTVSGSLRLSALGLLSRSALVECWSG